MHDAVETGGLTVAEVSDARRLHGWNELPTESGPSRLRVFLRQFSSFLVLILIIAAGVAMVLGEFRQA
ncbi:MAG: cation-transporting P-type ATPase, partial [Pseudomonadota bacterium]